MPHKKIYIPDSLIIGIDEIDKEHIELVEFINEGIELWDGGERDSHVFNEIFQSITTQVEEHFLHEEDIMLRNGYDGFDAHKSEHVHILKLLHHMEKQQSKFSMDELIFLFNQILYDIAYSDLNFSNYLHEKQHVSRMCYH